MNKNQGVLDSIGEYKTIIIAFAVVLVFLMIVCVVIWLPYVCQTTGICGSSTANSGNDQITSCEELLQRAMAASFDGCDNIMGSNQVCYGNFNVSAQLTSGDLTQFSMLGDTIPVSDLLTLNTAPMDLDQDIWGIAVFKLQANMPGTIPGQNVTFLVFGDTGLYNYSGDMYSVYFSTGIGSVTCSNVPDGLKVEVPEGSGVVFTANGAEIALQGDSVLTADPGESMSVTMLSGTGSVTSDGVTQTMNAGEYTTVPLSEDLQSEGPPSIPLPLPDDVAMELCLLTEQGCDPDDPSSAFVTATPGGVVILDATDTLAPELSTNTPVPVAPGLPTNTSVPLPPTITSASTGPTDTTAPGLPSNTPTNTLPPTNTPAPTDTQGPTSTPAPVCGSISLGGYSKNGNTVSIVVTNNNFAEVVIDGVNLNWDETTNGLLDIINISGQDMWGVGKTDASPPANITFSKDEPHRTIDGNSSVTLNFEFVDGASNPTSLQVIFDFGCTKSK